VIEAIAAGKKASLSVDRYLRGQLMEDEEVPRTIPVEDIDTARFNKRERQEMPMLPPERRVQGFAEAELGFTELQALREADRCFQCGLFPKKDK
jgi:NADH-quinone oxidoreductase subunit F